MPDMARPLPAGRYAPGAWTAVAGQGVWLLLSAEAGDGLVAEVWTTLRPGGDLTAVVEVLAGRGEREARDFALAAQSDAAVELALAGQAYAEVTFDDDIRRFECPAGSAVGRYRLADAPTSIRLAGGTEVAGSGRLPLSEGVVSAADVLLDWANRADEPALAQEAPPTKPAEVVDRADGIAPKAGAAATLPATSLPPVPAAEPDHAAPRSEEGGYDHLFGLTVNRSVEDAAVRPAEPELAHPDPSPNRVPAEPVVTVGEIPSVAPDPYPTGVSEIAGGLIDAVPWMDRPETTAPQPVSPAPQPDTPELTISRAAQAALLQRLSTPGSLVSVGPTVHAVRCPADHPNPAHADRCRVCGTPIADQPPVTVPRPVLGLLRMSSGDVVTLDRGVVLGRSPATDRLVNGERPHVVKLPSPEHDISRTHLEVSLDGWHVLVTDLKSTNGTLITRPGQAPERLRPEQPTIIEPGTLVTLSDDVHFTFEAVG